MRNKFHKSQGITLIALVVSMIILLVLAGISISMLTGENGIINRAEESKEKTIAANGEEQRKLAQAEALMNTEPVTYKGVSLPVGFAPTKIEGEDSIDKGLVITDGYGNEYVWVEVPRTIYTESKYNKNSPPSSADDWKKIKNCLKEYTVDYATSSYEDTNTDGITYSDDYKNMLKSVYTNEGFWIGRYEAGLEEGKSPRTSYVKISDNDKAVIKQNMYPYNYVTRDDAQALAERINYNGVTSSLIYGLQWDLVLKFIETKGATAKINLISTSTSIGNYNDSFWNITNAKAKYSTDSGKNFTACPYKKESNANVLLTTGANKSFSLMNIYDLAGNVLEWTREFCNTSNPYIGRGGSYANDGSNDFAGKRSNGFDANSCSYYIGFRLGLWEKST